MIGEVLGDENAHNKEIMYAYVDMLEFGDVSTGLRSEALWGLDKYSKGEY